MRLVTGVALIVSHFRIQNEMSHKPCYLGSWRQPVAFTWHCCRRSARRLIWTFHSEGNVLSFAQDVVQALTVEFSVDLGSGLCWGRAAILCVCDHQPI